MQHIEPAGVHSGDSTAILPPYSLSDQVIRTIEEYQEKIAESMEIVGFLSVKYAVKDEVIYVLEANPRSTRTIPFLVKATQRPEAKIGLKVMLGARLKDFALMMKLINCDINEQVLSFDIFLVVKT